MSGIVLHEPGALTLVAKAGTPVAGVERVLAAAHSASPSSPWTSAPSWARLESPPSAA
jgi:glycolate oxidase FAD binding subunit